MDCPSCGRDCGEGASFCSGCGTRLLGGVSPATRAAEGERKQVTVLFADVVAFTPLSERFDPETVREIMEPCFAILTGEIVRYGGTVNTFTGDGCMALFGAPVAHEDHAQRAVHAAWAIQQAAAAYGETVQGLWGVPFQLRLGLNTGLVVVGAVGGFEMQFTAMGDTVNLAARIQAVAAPGTVWVSETTQRAAGAAFRWRPVGPLDLKGKAESVPAYEVTGFGSVQGRFDVAAQRGLTRFVGRDSELAQLVAAWERAGGGGGQVVSVVGEAGLGKSRLTHEFKIHLAKHDAPLHEGSCFAYGEVTAYLPFLELLGSFFGLDSTTGVAEADAAVDAHLAKLAVGGSVAGFVHHVLGHPAKDDRVAALSSAVLRQRTVAALVDVVTAQAAATPALTLVVDDVHWIDTASQEVLTALVEAMTDVPLLLVLVYRPEYLHAPTEKSYHAAIALGGLGTVNTAAMVQTILAKSFAESVALESFSPEQSQAMLRNMLGVGDIPPELEAFIAARTDGNPLFVEELTRSLLESGDLVPDGEGYRLVRSPDELAVPTTVQGVLIQRVDRLAPELKSLLQVAAVLGRVFDHRLLGAVAELNGALDRSLAELGDLEFIYPTRVAPERQYSSKHVLTQEAVYGTLLRSRREAYHEQAGRAIETLHADRLEEHYERLADHYSHSANADKAVEYLALANQKAALAYATLEARRYFDDALARLDAMPDTPLNRHRRVALVANQFYVFFYLHQPAEYLEILSAHQEMAEAQDDQRLLGLFYQSYGFYQMFVGQSFLSIETTKKAAQAWEAGGDPAEAGVAYAMLDWESAWIDRYDDVMSWGTKALAAFETHFELHWRAFAQVGFGWSYARQGRFAEAIEECEAALQLGQEYQDNGVLSFVANFLSYSHSLRGDSDAALEWARFAVDKAATAADQLWASSFLADALARAGEPERAVEMLSGLVPVYEATGFKFGFVAFGTMLGWAHLRVGDLAAARRTLEAVIPVAIETGPRFYRGQAERLLGEVAVADHGDTAGDGKAAPHFVRSMEVLTEIGAENELAL